MEGVVAIAAMFYLAFAVIVFFVLIAVKVAAFVGAVILAIYVLVCVFDAVCWFLGKLWPRPH